tara:strand:+ start:739 stop:2055 length:1317 start_codon:yes stop_codon:yes gene_type:complete
MFATTHKIQGAGGAGGDDLYWLTTIAHSSSGVQNFGIRADNSNSVCGAGFLTGDNKSYLLKFEADGSISWNKTFENSNGTGFRGIASDYSGNIWTSGFDSPNGINRGILAKYSSSGSLQLQKTYGPASGQYVYFNYITIDSSNNIYASGPMTAGAVAYNYGPGLVKLNSSGVVQWQKTVAGGGSGSAKSPVDGSGNSFLIYSTQTSNSTITAIKLDSSGSVVWQKGISGQGYVYSRNAVVDSSGNLYISFACTAYSSGSNTGPAIVKLNSSGVVQWCRTLNFFLTNFTDNVAVNDAGDVYVSYVTKAVSGDKDIKIIKYNSSGSLQWQRSLGSSAAENMQFNSLALDKNDNVLVSFDTNVTGSGVNTSAVYVKLPPDGSGTGTYGSFVYAASSYTSTARSVSSSNLSNTVSNLSYSVSNASGTDSSTSYTENTYEITP